MAAESHDASVGTAPLLSRPQGVLLYHDYTDTSKRDTPKRDENFSRLVRERIKVGLLYRRRLLLKVHRCSVFQFIISLSRYSNSRPLCFHWIRIPASTQARTYNTFVHFPQTETAKPRQEQNWTNSDFIEWLLFSIVFHYLGFALLAQPALIFCQIPSHSIGSPPSVLEITAESLLNTLR